MYSYNLLFENCDKILANFNEEYPRSDFRTINMLADLDNPSKTNAAIEELINMGCIVKDTTSDTNRTWYIIKSKGLYIKGIGGFKEYLKELNQQKEFKKLLDEYSLKTNQSVIDTNNLVGQNVRTQERLTKFALLIAGIAAIIPTITLVKDIVSPTQLIDRDTKLLMKNTQVTIDSLRQNLDSINSSLKSLKNVSYCK